MGSQPGGKWDLLWWSTLTKVALTSLVGVTVETACSILWNIECAFYRFCSCRLPSMAPQLAHVAARAVPITRQSRRPPAQYAICLAEGAGAAACPASCCCCEGRDTAWCDKRRKRNTATGCVLFGVLSPWSLCTMRAAPLDPAHRPEVVTHREKQMPSL